MIIILSHTLTIQNLSDIERVDAFKYAVFMSRVMMSWNNHVACIYKRANSRLHFLHRCSTIMKPRREPRWNMLGCPKLANRSQPLMGQRSPYC